MPVQRGVQLYAWNPDRETPDDGAGTRVVRPVRNFGDLLGPRIVLEVLRRHRVDPARAVQSRRLLTVGSVLHFAKDEDVIWGSGINGKATSHPYERVRRLDIRAVRGPLTATCLRAAGHRSPAVYGDPGSLVAQLWPREGMREGRPSIPVLVVPNLNDVPTCVTQFPVLDPRSPVDQCLGAIASSELVIASSLHALVVAEAYGVPAIRLRSATEPDFKYDDYYLATGRPTHQCVASVEEGIEAGPCTPAPELSLKALVDAFPFDLWEPSKE